MPCFNRIKLVQRLSFWLGSLAIALSCVMVQPAAAAPAFIPDPPPDTCGNSIRCPSAPTELSVTAKTQTSISIQWKDNAKNELGFEILRSRPSPGWFQLAQLDEHTGTGTMTFTDSNLTPATNYC